MLVSICHTILDFPETAPLQDQVAKENSGDHCCQISYGLEDHRVANENGVKALKGHQSGRINVKVYYNDLSYDLPTTGNGLRKNNAGRVDCLEDSSTVDTPCHLSYQHRRHTLRPQFLVHAQEVDFNHLLLTTNTDIQASLRVFTDVCISLLEGSDMSQGNFSGAEEQFLPNVQMLTTEPPVADSYYSVARQQNPTLSLLNCASDIFI